MQDAEMLLVQMFHERMGIKPPNVPQLMRGDVADFRQRFMLEELNEFSQACAEGDLVAAFDALLDLVYVAKGTALLMGLGPFEWRQGMLMVQQANMAKERVHSAEQSKRGHSLDVRKPAGWVGPETALRQILREAGGDC